MSLPTFVHDVAWAFAEWVNEESYKFAATGKAEYPFVAPEGGKEPLRAQYSAYTMGSDHDVYQDSSFGIPAIYLNDWPDRYIHTNFDTAANIDPTKLKRAAFIGAASGYFLAGLTSADLTKLSKETRAGNTRLMSEYEAREAKLPEKEGQSLITRMIFQVGLRELSAKDFVGASKKDEFLRTQARFLTATTPAKGDGLLQFQRREALKGPLAVFGYDYFAEHAKAAGVATPKLLGYEGLWGSGEDYAYEVLNFADGKRNAQEIRDAVSAEYGPVPLEKVMEYLKALEKIGVVEQVK
jgi:hypothetical protein